jgi:hypothetical protein
MQHFQNIELEPPRVATNDNTTGDVVPSDHYHSCCPALLALLSERFCWKQGKKLASIFGS